MNTDRGKWREVGSIPSCLRNTKYPWPCLSLSCLLRNNPLREALGEQLPARGENAGARGSALGSDREGLASSQAA